jgi:hypothetical protein
MSLSLYTQIEEFTKNYKKDLWKELLKEKKVQGYIDNQVTMIESELKGYLDMGYYEHEAIEIIRAEYMNPSN